MRENKRRALEFTYNRLGFKNIEFKSNHSRGVYFSRLYKNTDEFLRGEIAENQLKPAFDNSIEALTEFWRFGRVGDTTTSPLELTNEFGKDLNRGAKGRLDKQVNKNDEFWIDESIKDLLSTQNNNVSSSKYSSKSNKLI